jgi:uncharacterized damage-inducible protein DinB
MPTSDPIEILLETNLWATHHLLDACRSLTDEQFHQKFQIGLGSLHDTLTHVLGAMRAWGDLIGGREPQPRLEADHPRTVDQLKSMLDEIAADFAASARAHPTDEIVTGSRGGREYSFARGAVIVHVTTHGMHHRAQCLNMLRCLGVDPLPHSSVLEWTMMADSNQAN